jgi:hypothetical protein
MLENNGTLVVQRVANGFIVHPEYRPGSGNIFPFSELHVAANADDVAEIIRGWGINLEKES